MDKIVQEINEIKKLIKQPIVLVGLMGVGKTTIGKILAKELGLDFYDSDEEIVKMAGKSISQIFSEDGESAFRIIERHTIQQLLATGPCVIAVGGGAITIRETANEIMDKTLCIWIDAPIDILVERTRNSDRPLLQHGDPEDILTNLYEKRRPAYAQAHVHIHVQDIGLTPEDTAARIILQLREHIFMNSSDTEVEKNIPNSLCLNVTLGEYSYPIFIGKDILCEPDIWLDDKFHGRKAFIITDYNVREIIVDKLQEIIRPYMKSIAVMELPPGEQSKSFDRYEAIIEWLVDNGVTRDSLIFAVGGGVVGDLAGFAAATILRGIDFIQIPTTLLSQVDSSVGGKTGINTSQAKNMVGAFYQPRTVVIDLTTTATLPIREMRAGYAEIVKYALINDENFFNWLEGNGKKLLSGDHLALLRAIEISCHTKAEIVANDEFETSGRRALLNFGHTFGHAIEKIAKYNGSVLHGEAVSVGLVLAAKLSNKLNLLNEEDVLKIENHLKNCEMPTQISDLNLSNNINIIEIMDAMKHDKKMTKDGLTFITLNKLGHATLTRNIPEEIIVNIIKESIK